MKTTVKKWTSQALRRLRVFEPVFGLLEIVRKVRLEDLRSRRKYAEDRAWGSHPIPPVGLMVSSAGTANVDWFLSSGKAGASCVTEAARAAGRPIDRCRRILDLGCGCGRVVRHLEPTESLEIYGCDFNKRAVEWSGRSLGPRRFFQNALTPPLALASGMLDLVNAFSVFTHLPEELQKAWVAEVRRVLTTEGLLILSLHGDAYYDSLDTREQRTYDAGDLVVRSEESPGSNRCAAYHPNHYVRSQLFLGWDVLDHQPRGATGNPPQDLWVLTPGVSSTSVPSDEP